MSERTLYTGRFSVELTSDADKRHLPRAHHLLKTSGNVLRVALGSYEFVNGCVHIVAGEHKLAWAQSFVMAIRDEHGLPLWVNRNYSEMERRELIKDAIGD